MPFRSLKSRNTCSVQIDPPNNVSAFFNNVVDGVTFRLQFNGDQPAAGTVLVDSTYGFVQLRFTTKGNFSLQLMATDGELC